MEETKKEEPEIELSPAAKLGRALAFFAGCALLYFSSSSWFWSVISLGAVVFVHELGHFTVCKLSKIKVEKFSIGFWTPLISMKRGDTTYQIAAIPLGGYVKPAGEFEEREGAVVEHPKDHFLGKPWYIRGLVLLAGPLANFVLPVAFFFILYATLGRPYIIAPPLIEDVVEESAADEAGVLKGDQILKIDGEWATSTDQLAKLIDAAARRHPGKETDLLVLRHDKQLKLKALSRLDKDLGRYRLGIAIAPGPSPQRREIERVGPGTPAEKSGFKAGDEVLSVDGQVLKAGTKFAEIFATAKGRKNDDGDLVVDIEVIRAGKPMQLAALKRQPIPSEFDPKDVGLVGLEFALDQDYGGGNAKRYQKMGVLQAAKLSLYENYFMAAAMLAGLRDLVVGRLKFKESVSSTLR